MWRAIDKDENGILAAASRFERDFPTFYREASQTWTVDEEAIREFYRSCESLYGIFKKKGSVQELIGLVYFQSINEWHKVVHLDAKRGADKQTLLTGFCMIRKEIFRSGVKQVQTWALRQNRSLQEMLRVTGFQRTGLEMRAGRAHGRTLRWVQMIVRSH